MSHFAALGWTRAGPDDFIARWAEAALTPARAAMATGQDWRCGGTWFPGIDALGNDPDGGVGGEPFPPPLAEFVAAHAHLPENWHRAQVSACLPGYPRPDPRESAAAARYRRHRASAHVDGLLPIGLERRRMLREPHAFILGVKLAGGEASPLVVWEGSHEIIRAALADAFSGHEPRTWPRVDVTEAYHAARRRCFETCVRVKLPLETGSALLLHRLALHGVGPWQGEETEPRIIVYFRPLLTRIEDWLGRL